MLIALVVVPLAFAFCLIALPRARLWVIGWFTCIGIGIHLLMASAVLITKELPYTYNIGGWERSLGIWLLADEVSMAIVMLASVLVLMAVSYSLATRIADKRYYSLILVMLASLSGWALTNDLFNMFVFIELASVTAYTLTAYERTRQSFEAAFKYVVLGTLAGLLVFIAILLIYFSTGELNMALALSQIDRLSPTAKLLFWGLMITGLASKSGLAPVHMWLPDVHSSAPTPISALLSGIVIKLGLYSTYRLYDLAYGLGNGPDFLLSALLICGSLSVLIGHLVAWQQDDIKRFLAYSTVAQIGYVIIGLQQSTTSATGALFHIANHAFLKASLFFVAGVMADWAGSRRIPDFQGVGRRLPIVGAVFTLAAFGMVGIPPLNGFTSKWLITVGVLEGGWSLAAVAIPIGTLISAIYYLRILRIIWGSPGEDAQGFRLNNKLWPIALSAAGILALTCFAPQVVLFLAKGV